MTIVAPAGQYPEGIQGYGHVPGVRGGAIGSFAKIASKLTYRGTKYLASRFFKPKKYTYPGAVGRGIGVGTIIASQLGDDFEDGIGNAEIPTSTNGNRYQQRNRRFRSTSRKCRRHNRRNCC